MYPLKTSWFNLVVNICIIICILSATTLLFTINHLDTIFLSGNLISAFSGTPSVKENYYLLCFIKKITVLFWSFFLGENFNSNFVMLYFSGSTTSGTIIYLRLSNDIRQIATVLFLFAFILFVLPIKSIKNIKNIFYTFYTLVLWIGFIYFRGEFIPTFSGPPIPFFVSLTTTANQEFWLALLLGISEIIFIGIVPIYILFIKDIRFLVLILIGISFGWLGFYFTENFLGEIICSEHFELKISPFR